MAALAIQSALKAEKSLHSCACNTSAHMPVCTYRGVRYETSVDPQTHTQIKYERKHYKNAINEASKTGRMSYRWVRY